MPAEELIREIRDAMAALSGSRAKLVARELAERTGLSVRHIYALTNDLRRRKPRADAGTRRLALDQSARDTLFALVRIGLTAELALKVARGNGVVTAENAPSAGTLRRWMRAEGVGIRTSAEDRVCRRWSAEYPDQVHQVDCTISATFYLDGDGAVEYLPLREQSNRPEKKRDKLHLFTLIDDFSRATYARYYLEENTGNWLDFLWHAWGPKEDPSEFPFEGVPEILYADNGSPLKSERAKRAIGALGVEPKFHRPYHPQSKGKVERRIGVLQAQFEALFLLHKPKTLGEANDLLYKHLLLANMERHSQTKQLPFQRWLLRVKPIQRLPADHILKMLGRVRDTRVLGPDLTFSVNGERFMAPYVEPFRSMPRGQKVEVLYAPECPFEVLVVSGRSAFKALHVPAGTDPAQVCALPAADEARTRTNAALERTAATGLAHLDGFAHEREAARQAQWLPQPHEAAAVERDVPDRPMSDVATMMHLQNAGVCARPAAAEDRALVARLLDGAETIGESALTEVIRRFRGKGARTALAALMQERKTSGGAEAVSGAG